MSYATTCQTGRECPGVGAGLGLLWSVVEPGWVPWQVLSGSDKARRKAYGDNIMESFFLNCLLEDISTTRWSTSL